MWTDHLSGIQALFNLVLLIGMGVVLLANTRKFDRKLLQDTMQEYKDVAEARSTRIEQLEKDIGYLRVQMAALEAQVAEGQKRLAEYERNEVFLQRVRLSVEQKLESTEARVKELERR